MYVTTMTRYCTLLAASLLLPLPCTLAAQCVDRPLPSSFSTRGLAMGNANLASRDDDVIFYGPAQLAVARGTSVAGEGYPGKLASATMATTSRIASGGVGLGAQVVEGQNNGPCAALPLLPNGQPPAQTITRTLGVVGGAFPFKRFRFGVDGKYAAEQADANHASSLLADVGVARDFSVADFLPLTAVLAFQSIGPDPTRAIELGVPREASLGLASSGPFGPLDFVIAVQGGVEHNGTPTSGIKNRPLARGGVELGYSWLDGYSFAVRAGARTAEGYELTRHFTAGAGIVLDRLSIDYALEELTNSTFGQRLGIRLR